MTKLLERPPARSSSPSLRDRAKLVRSSLLNLGRNLGRVDDSILDLPLRQLKVCLTLYAQSGPMSEISREIGVSLSAMTQIADRLERTGLIERVSAGADRRMRILKLTAKGERLMRSHETAQLKRMADCLERLTPAQTNDVLKALALLVQASGPPDATSAS